MSDAQCAEHKVAARRELQNRLQVRRESRAALLSATSKAAWRDEGWEWLLNERRLDEVFTVLQEQSPNLAKDRVLCGRVSQLPSILRSKPTLLQPHLDELEMAHPWSRKLANLVSEMEDALLG